MRDAGRTAHVESTVEAIAHMHAEHRTQATPFQRFTESLTAYAGRSAFVAWLTIAVVLWMSLNLAMAGLGHRMLDPPPFAWMDGAVSLAALYMTVLILSMQRRDTTTSAKRDATMVFGVSASDGLLQIRIRT